MFLPIRQFQRPFFPIPAYSLLLLFFASFCPCPLFCFPPLLPLTSTFLRPCPHFSLFPHLFHLLICLSSFFCLFLSFSALCLTLSSAPAYPDFPPPLSALFAFSPSFSSPYLPFLFLLSFPLFFRSLPHSLLCPRLPRLSSVLVRTFRFFPIFFISLFAFPLSFVFSSLFPLSLLTFFPLLLTSHRYKFPSTSFFVAITA